MYVSRFLRPINYWQDLDDLRDEMNLLFEDFGSQSMKTFPLVNLWSDDDEALLKAELPGMSRNDINITVQNNMLTIEGNRKLETLRENEDYHRRERGYGNFKRTIRLPFAVDSDKIKAEVSNGVLTVNLPRREEDKPKKIEISTS
ncbi:MAG: Hsp20/alpha crystallin family protein [bacterium]